MQHRLELFLFIDGQVTRRSGATKNSLYDCSQLCLLGVTWLHSWYARRKPPGSDHCAAAAGKSLQRFHDVERNPFDPGQNYDAVLVRTKRQRALVHAPDLSQRCIIKKIKVITGFEDSRNNVLADQLSQSVDHVNMSRREMGVRITIRQIKSDIVCRLSLAQQITQAL